jgi:hypothetical protein
MDDELLVELLTSIDRRLALLTGAQERDICWALKEDLLRTPGRTAMFDSVDGQRETPDVAKAAGVSLRAVQLFVREMIDMGIFREVGARAGGGLVAAHDDSGIVRWYFSRVAE